MNEFRVLNVNHMSLSKLLSLGISLDDRDKHSLAFLKSLEYLFMLKLVDA